MKLAATKSTTWVSGASLLSMMDTNMGSTSDMSTLDFVAVVVKRLRKPNKNVLYSDNSSR